MGTKQVNKARRPNELARENGNLKKMLAEALFQNRVLEAVWAKMVRSGHCAEAVAAKMCLARRIAFAKETALAASIAEGNGKILTKSRVNAATRRHGA